MDLLAEALRESEQAERKAHEEALRRLQQQHDRLAQRLRVAYLDRVDGRLDTASYDQLAQEWRAEQDRLRQTMEQHHVADRCYIDDGIRLLELARKAREYFISATPDLKKRILEAVCQNSAWKHGKLTVEFREPFDLLEVTDDESGPGVVGSGPNRVLSPKWQAPRDSNPQPSALETEDE